MNKKQNSFLSIFVSVMMAMSMVLGLQSCGQVDNSLEDIINTVVENTGANPDDVTALINAAMSDEAVQEALASGEPINVEVTGGTTATNQTITIPMTTAGAGQNKVVINLTFTEALDSSEDNPLEFKADEGSGADAGDSDNQLNINMPAATGLVITINLPKTTVVLTSNGSGTVYKSVNSKTAMETLIISENVTVEELLIADGTVIVKEGGKVEGYVYQPDDEEKTLLIFNDGSVKPFSVNVNGEEKFELRNEDGSAYYAPNLKIVKGSVPYANIWFGNSKTAPLKKLTIADGAAVKTTWASLETIEGEGSAEIKYHINPWYDENDNYYDMPCDMYHVKTLRNILFSTPEYNPDDLTAHPGAQVKEPRMNLDVYGTVENCTFQYNHVFFCVESETIMPTVTNCKFEQSGENSLIDMWIPYDANRESNTMTFNNCVFGSDTKFKASFINLPNFDSESGIQYTAYINFNNCKLGSVDLTSNINDIFNQIWAFSCTRIIISINGVPKYQSENGSSMAEIDS